MLKINIGLSRKLSENFNSHGFTRIGKKANVIVKPANEKLGHPVKYASAHDLRRSCSERLREAGVPPLVICSVMRHSSWEVTERHYAPGNIQRDAELLRSALSQK